MYFDFPQGAPAPGVAALSVPSSVKSDTTLAVRKLPFRPFLTSHIPLFPGNAHYLVMEGATAATINPEMDKFTLLN